jgi:hypothetical protein
MADELRCHRFVAAVFRDPGDVAQSISRLLQDSFTASQFLVLVSHDGTGMGQALKRNGVEGVSVAPLKSTDPLPLGSGLRHLLGKMKAIDRQLREAGAPFAVEDTHPIYSRLPAELARGAFILIFAVEHAEQQLRGARMVLRGNSECVLTHELELSEYEDHAR